MRFSNMDKLKHFLKLSYLIILTRIYNFIFKKPTVRNDIETLHKIIHEQCSVARFGDGEIAIVNGVDLKFQSSDKHLHDHLQRVLQSKEDKMMICIPDIFHISSLRHLTYESKVFWLNELIHNRSVWYCLPKDRIYYDACITRPYIRNANKQHSKDLFTLLKQIWNKKDVVIIEGTHSRLGVENDLFTNCHSIQRLLCPPKNAFQQYDKILQKAKNLDHDRLILISLGPSATVLAYDLFLEGFQAIDLGHIDLEYEWFLQKSEKRVQIKNKSVNELSEEIEIAEFVNEEYEKQIIGIIKEESTI